MPLIILGLIVVLGGALLIYYQLGPKVTLRLKSGFGGGGPFASAPNEAEGEKATESETGADAGEKQEKEEDEKILYIFGAGEREERSLRKDGQAEDDEKGEE